MQARIQNPAMLMPEALKALLSLGAVARSSGIALRTLDLIYLRVSQINGCGVCLEMHARDLRKAGESDERLFTLAGWRDTAYFTPAERAALALAEAATRISDRADPVNDEVWNEAARYYNEAQLAALVLNIAMINLWNRLNVTTRQLAGSVSDTDAHPQPHAPASAA